MKRTLWLWVVAGVVWGMSTSAWAQNTEEHGKLIEHMVSQIKTVLTADKCLYKNIFTYIAISSPHVVYCGAMAF